MKRLGELQDQFSTQSANASDVCQKLMLHPSVNSQITAAVDNFIHIERASAQSISTIRVSLAECGFNMKSCGFTLQNDKMEADLPGLQESWDEVKRSIVQSQNAVVTVVTHQIQSTQ